MVSHIITAILRSPFGRILAPLLRIVTSALQAISPATLARTDRNTRLNRNPLAFYKSVVKYVFPAAVFLCLVMNGVMSFLAGTFSGQRLSYAADLHNLFLYLSVIPAYVSVALCLVLTCAIAWRKLRDHAEQVGSARNSSIINAIRTTACITVALGASSFFIVQYQNDLADPGVIHEVYWFFHQTEMGGRSINIAGIYYFTMNGTLLFITLVAVLCFVSVSFEIFRLGRSIELSTFAITRQGTIDNGDNYISLQESRLKGYLSESTWCYAGLKLSVCLYVVNIWIWQLSPAGRVGNVHWAIFALVIVGVVFVTIPHLYLASKWHNHKVSCVASEGNPISLPRYETLISPTVEKVVVLIDLSLLTLLAIVLDYQYGMSGVTDIIRFMRQ